MLRITAARDLRGSVGSSDEYASFNEAYPMVTYGKADEFCRDDRDCRFGLQCKTNILTQAQTCRLPEFQSIQATPLVRGEPQHCTRTPSDPTCHRDTQLGRIRCRDSECSPKKLNTESTFLDRFTSLIGFNHSQNAVQLPATQKVPNNKCASSETLEYLPTGQKVCVYLNPETNAAERMPDKCCDDFLTSNYNHEDEYVRYALSPQYYGLYR